MRAEGVTWNRLENHAGTCSLCRGIIVVGEPFVEGRRTLGEPQGSVCLTCAVTAMGPVLPGNPKVVVVERAVDPLSVHGEYFLTVDGEELGILTVDGAIPWEQHVPALLTLVWNALARRVQAVTGV